MSFVTLEGKKIPIVSIGTSPFMGAGQFGPKGLLWRQKFLNNPENVSELLVETAQNGGMGIEIVPVGKISEALPVVNEKFPEFTVTGSTYWEKPYRIDKLNEIGAEIIFIHGAITDRMNLEEIKNIIQHIRILNRIPGIATHNPTKTIPFIEQSGLDCPAILVPFNKLGIFMEDQKLLERIVDNSNKFFVAMKSLGAGRIKPEEAFQYLSEHNISAVAIGMVTFDEIKESVPVALEKLSR
ncbi:MAG: hypothetical protein ACTSO9_08155 [Candidatus Helarchaeota archaeon]